MGSTRRSRRHGHNHHRRNVCILPIHRESGNPHIDHTQHQTTTTTGSRTRTGQHRIHHMEPKNRRGHRPQMPNEHPTCHAQRTTTNIPGHQYHIPHCSNHGTTNPSAGYHHGPTATTTLHQHSEHHHNGTNTNKKTGITTRTTMDTTTSATHKDTNEHKPRTTQQMDPRTATQNINNGPQTKINKPTHGGNRDAT